MSSDRLTFFLTSLSSFLTEWCIVLHLEAKNLDYFLPKYDGGW